MMQKKKSLKTFIVEALLALRSKRRILKEKNLMARAAQLASRLNDEDILVSIRGDRYQD